MNQDAKYIANQLRMVALLSESLAYDIINAKNDPFSTPDSQMAQSSSGCCGGKGQPPTTTTTTRSNPLVHPGFAAFSQQTCSPFASFSQQTCCSQTNNSDNKDWTSVVSSSIKAVAYDKNKETLSVKFQDNDVYEYSNVPSAIYSAFMIAPSKGTILPSEYQRCL